jgi:hypothetical protein
MQKGLPWDIGDNGEKCGWTRRRFKRWIYRSTSAFKTSVGRGKTGEESATRIEVVILVAGMFQY